MTALTQIAICLSVFMSLQKVSAQLLFDQNNHINTPVRSQKVSEKFLNRSLQHAQTINVRQELETLLQGDFVESLHVVGSSLQQGGYLEIIMDSTVINRLYLDQNFRNHSVQIGRVNGIDYRQLIIRSIGSTHVQSIAAFVPNQPNPPPFPPPVYGDEKSSLFMRETVIANDREYVRTEVVGQENTGKYIIRFLEGALAGQVGGNWGRESLSIMRGCSSTGFCVGDRLINTQREYVDVRITGLEFDGQYVTDFLQGSLAGKRGGNWDIASLARTSGCSDEGICVGDVMINTKREYVRVRVIGLELNNKYVLEFLQGSLAGKRGGNWGRGDLARGN